MPVSQIVNQRLVQLRKLREDHLEAGREMLKDPALFPMDMLAMAVLRRSLQLIWGFSSLIESQNLGAAAPLLRLQVDSCIRFAAAWLVEGPHEFALKVLGGTPVKKMKTREGQPMTDQHLVAKLALRYPWLTSVYKHTSGYVHFSEKHILNCLKMGGDTDFKMVVSEVDSFLTDDLYLEVIQAFEHSTVIILTYCYGWAHTKNNPHLLNEKAHA